MRDVGGERALICAEAAESDCRQSVTASPAKSSKMAFYPTAKQDSVSENDRRLRRRCGEMN